MNERALDVVCYGRSCIDLYGEQVGCTLEQTSSFAKYVGGCATNIAIGTSRLGLRSGLLTRVGDEQLGRFVLQTLNAEGVDTSRITTDPARLTALVILGIQDQHTFPHIFYRPDPADMAIEPTHVDAGYIADAHAVLVTGTHFSTPGVEATGRRIIELARAAGTRVILDIDYRPVLWGLARHADGDSRFVSDEAVSARLQSLLGDCDLVVGTEEEIHIAGGTTDTLDAVRNIRRLSDAVIVVKRGALGCVVIADDVPDDLEHGTVAEGTPVEVFNTLGAGDGFMSGFLRGWLKGEPLATAAQYGNIAGALVVSRHGCAPAMPSWSELEHVIKHGQGVDQKSELEHLHRVSTRYRDWPEVMALAFDHRHQFETLAEQHGGSPRRIVAFKTLLAEAVRRAGQGVTGAGAIVDGRFGVTALAELTGEGRWLARPVEKPATVPLEFECGANPAVELRSWPSGQIAKCLVFYHPRQEPSLRELQEQRIVALHEACAATGHELLLEIILPAELPADETTLAQAVSNMYRLGVRPDWWKLPPVKTAAEWRSIGDVIRRFDPWCRGILILGLNAPLEDLKQSFEVAVQEPLCRGFAIGRSIFQSCAERWFGGELADEAVIDEVAANYRSLIDTWREVKSAS